MRKFTIAISTKVAASISTTEITTRNHPHSLPLKVHLTYSTPLYASRNYKLLKHLSMYKLSEGLTQVTRYQPFPDQKLAM